MKRILKAVQLIFIAILISININTVYAETTGNIDGPNAGGQGNESTNEVHGGYHSGDNGYRIYIVDSSSPTVLQKVYDIYFDNDPTVLNLKAMDQTWVGNASQSGMVPASYYGLEDMPRATAASSGNTVGNGENLKKWMLSSYGGEILDSKNATNGLYLAYKLFAQNDADALEALTTGDAKLVIEAVYWYRPNNNKNEQIMGPN